MTAAEPAAGTEVGPVLTVDSVRVMMNRKMPPGIVIVATGTARSGGWTGLQLERLPDPDSATLLYRFVGRAPAGPATMAITEVEARASLDPLPDTVTTVRIEAATSTASASVR